MMTWAMHVVVLLFFLGVSTIAALSVSKESPKKFLVVGGNGRVGGSTAKHLHILSTAEGLGPAQLVLGGRSQDSFQQSKARILQQLTEDKTVGSSAPPDITFQSLDLDTEDPLTLVEAIKACGADCVIHTAGPFQQRTRPILLEASIQAGLPYCDVCDEPPLCAASKKLQKDAEGSGSVAVVAGGIWPGASALMAAEAVAELRRLEESGDPSIPCNGEKVDMSFFTAGTGNAGATIVSATFLLLCQPALTFLQGKQVDKEPWTSPLEVDFGRGVGKRTVRLLDNPDIYTIHEALQVPTLCSRFATAPGVWNQLFGAMKTVIPPSILANKELMQGLSIFSLPIIRAVDLLVGATNAMRVDARGERGSHVRFSVTHNDLEQCVGLATAAFALELLSSSAIKPGVYFPADLPSVSRSAILERVKRDATVWEFEAKGPGSN